MTNCFGCILIKKRTHHTLCLLHPQKRYDGHHVAQSLSPRTHQPSSCGTAPAPPTIQPPGDPLRSQTTHAQTTRTPSRPSPSCLTATTTCQRKCTRYRCPRPRPMAAARRHEKPRARAAPGARRRALHVSSSSCRAPSWTPCSSARTGAAGLLWTSGTAAVEASLKWRWRTGVRGKSTATTIRYQWPSSSSSNSSIYCSSRRRRSTGTMSSCPFLLQRSSKYPSDG